MRTANEILSHIIPVSNVDGWCHKVRILAGLVLINCVKGRASLGNEFPPLRSGSSSNTSAKSPFEASSGGGGGGGGEPHALDMVIAHRVMPLFFRTLASWASSPHAPTSLDSSYRSNALLGDDFRVTCRSRDGADAEAVARAIAAGIQFGSPERQREAVRHGAVEALTSFLWRAQAATASAQRNGNSGNESLEDVVLSPSPKDDAEAGIAGATVAALGAMAILCKSCELACEKLVTVGFHSALAFWLTADADGDDLMDMTASVAEGVGGGDAARLATLDLIRNVSRANVSCSALVGVGLHESLIDVLEGWRGIDVRGEEDVAGEVWHLAAGGLANMALGHEVVTEAIDASDCLLRKICDYAIGDRTEDKVGFNVV